MNDGGRENEKDGYTVTWRRRRKGEEEKNNEERDGERRGGL